MMEERGRKGVDLWNRFFLIPTLPRDGGSSVIGSINQDSIRRHYSVLDPRSLLSLSPRGREENASIHACRSYTNVCVCVCVVRCSRPARESRAIYTGNIESGLARSDGLESCSRSIPRGY